MALVASIIFLFLTITVSECSNLGKCEKQRNDNYICPTFDFSTLPGGKQLAVTVQTEDLQPLKEVPYNPNIWLLDIKKSLSSVEPNAFENLPGLRVLILEGNKLPVIEPNTFGNLNLISLVLQDNRISEIKPEAFQNSKFVLLSIGNNNLTEISKGMFNNLDVKELDLRSNGIASIEEGALADLPNLNTLRVSNNTLTSFDANSVLGSAPNLHVLHLQHNKLTTINSKTFEGLQNLTSLLLGSNEITDIELGTFNLPYLKRLDLGNNNIKTLDSNILTSGGLKYLWQFYVHNNALTFLPSDFLSQLPDLGKIVLDSNPWQCRCLDVMLKWIQENLPSYEHSSEGGKPVCLESTKNSTICDQDYSLDEAELENFRKLHSEKLEVYS